MCLWRIDTCDGVGVDETQGRESQQTLCAERTSEKEPTAVMFAIRVAEDRVQMTTATAQCTGCRAKTKTASDHLRLDNPRHKKTAQQNGTQHEKRTRQRPTKNATDPKQNLQQNTPPLETELRTTRIGLGSKRIGQKVNKNTKASAIMTPPPLEMGPR